MIAAVSESLRPVSRPASTASTGWFFSPVPDLNRKTREKLGQEGAGWTFTTICTELHDQGRACTDARKRKAAKEQQVLGIGFHALARESGQSIGKVRRDVRKLVGMGLVVVIYPNFQSVRDPVTGQITQNRLGRCKAALIYLTITQEHLRPPKASKASSGGARLAPIPAADGTNLVPPQAANRVQPEPTVREEKKQRTPDGHADGVGRPPAVTADTPPDFLKIVTADPESAGMPPGRILPTPKASASPRAPGRQEPPAPSAWTGSAAEAARRQMEAYQRHLDEEARRNPPVDRLHRPAVASPA